MRVPSAQRMSQIFKHTTVPNMFKRKAFDKRENAVLTATRAASSTPGRMQIRLLTHRGPGHPDNRKKNCVLTAPPVSQAASGSQPVSQSVSQSVDFGPYSLNTGHSPSRFTNGNAEAGSRCGALFLAPRTDATPPVRSRTR